MTSSQETDRAYSNKKPQLPEPARGMLELGLGLGSQQLGGK